MTTLSGPRDSDLVDDYLRLGLRFGRLVDGYVDCWIGGDKLARQVADEPAPVPAELARRAGELTLAVDGSGLAPHRRRYLTTQLRGLACAARRLGDEPMPYLAEVAEYFDVEVRPTDPDRYPALHDRLGELLPGAGPLHERLVRFRGRHRLAGSALARGVRAVSEALRERLGDWLDLPADERVEYEIVRDRPWNAFNEYLGGHRSRIIFNEDAGHWVTGLTITATHEAYPGHHAEHCLKERELVARRGEREHCIALVNTAQCLMAEGTAELGLRAALGEGWGTWTEEVLAGEGIRFDGALCERVDGLMWQLTEARQDAAIMLHDRGADPDAVRDFLARSMLVDDRVAGQALRFLSDPLWRAYIVTYIEGRRLVGRWLTDGAEDAAAEGVAAEGATARYRRLLTEQLLPADLREDLASPAPAARS